MVASTSNVMFGSQDKGVQFCPLSVKENSSTETTLRLWVVAQLHNSAPPWSSQARPAQHHGSHP